MQTDLFRKEAVSKFLRGDVPGAAITIARPWTVAVFGTMAFVLVALLGLAIFGHAQVVASGRGVVRPNKPAIVVHAPFNGTVTKIASRGEGKAKETLLLLDARGATADHEKCAAQLEKENAELAGFEEKLAQWDKIGAEASNALVILAQVRSQREKVAALTQKCDAAQKIIDKSNVTFPVDARVQEVAVSEGGEVHEGDVLATLVPSSAQLVGYSALSETYRSEVEVGQTVQLRFDALPSNEVGAGKGHVTRVLDALPTGVKIDAQEPTGLFVEVAIDGMPRGSGPPRTGMTFGCDVLTRRPTILSMLFSGGI